MPVLVLCFLTAKIKREISKISDISFQTFPQDIVELIIGK